jgi:hypothetical protein
MPAAARISLLALLLCGSAQAQTLEGYWQDTARRILFARDAPPSYAYGAWTLLDQDQTYPAAKEIRRSAEGLAVVELNFDDGNYKVETISAADDTVAFVRTVKWSGCAMHHRCRLEGEAMVCSLVNVCPQDGKNIVDWRGEERYVRRANCERQGKVQAQGFPVACH